MAKNKKWHFDGDQSREEHLVNRVLFAEWVGRHNQTPFQQIKAASKKRRPQPPTLLATELKKRYTHQEPVSKDEFIHCLEKLAGDTHDDAGYIETHELSQALMELKSSGTYKKKWDFKATKITISDPETDRTKTLTLDSLYRNYKRLFKNKK
ncbi:MAG TPA: hypothetical protein ENJ80_10215 [Gammaproteobacteria bacterium]|nr:hypothetical protein [Gammaproteobacteria bacterium]